jgi:hypothetical protein
MDAKRSGCPGPDTMIHFWGLGFASGPECSQRLCLRGIESDGFRIISHSRKQLLFRIGWTKALLAKASFCQTQQTNQIKSIRQYAIAYILVILKLGTHGLSAVPRSL